MSTNSSTLPLKGLNLSYDKSKFNFSPEPFNVEGVFDGSAIPKTDGLGNRLNSSGTSAFSSALEQYAKDNDLEIRVETPDYKYLDTSAGAVNDKGSSWFDLSDKINNVSAKNIAWDSDLRNINVGDTTYVDTRGLTGDGLEAAKTRNKDNGIIDGLYEGKNGTNWGTIADWANVGIAGLSEVLKYQAHRANKRALEDQMKTAEMNRRLAYGDLENKVNVQNSLAAALGGDMSASNNRQLERVKQYSGDEVV